MRNFISLAASFSMTLLVTILTNQSASYAVNYYVSGSGSDTNNGLATTSPFRTIQKAANLTVPGDTVFVMNGTYTNSHNGGVVEITRSGSASAWITYKAYPGHLPKIKFNGWHGFFVRNGASYLEINGFEIEGNNSNITLDYAISQSQNISNPLTNGNGITVDGRNDGAYHPHHIRILNNKVHKCGGAGISIIQSDYVTINKNEVFDNSWYTVFGTSGISLWQNWRADQSTGYKMYVTNNKVYNNRNYIPWIYEGKITDGNGIIIDDSKNTQNGSTLGAYTGRTLVANNVVFNNGGSGIHSYMSEHVDIFNNTAYMNGQAPEIDDGEIFANNSSDVVIRNNILYAQSNHKINSNYNNTNVTSDYNILFGGSSIAIKGPNDIVQNPGFVAASTNPLVANFYLQQTSPSINKGLALSSVKYDIVGTARPSGTSHEIGAYEYKTATASTKPKPKSSSNMALR